ncbi:hypothetical protein MKX01_040963, partial [Papaver californicum]
VRYRPSLASQLLYNIPLDEKMGHAWVEITIAPAWLPTDMLIKSYKLDYKRM